MKKSVIFITAMLFTVPAKAGILDDLFGWSAPQQQTVSRNKRSKRINNYYAGGSHNASWYNDRSGRTASGMHHHYGVAHRTLPFGTRLCIDNPSNGRQVTAVVTDRGPFVKGRTIDVNQNVRLALGFNGTAHLNYSTCN